MPRRKTKCSAGAVSRWKNVVGSRRQQEYTRDKSQLITSFRLQLVATRRSAILFAPALRRARHSASAATVLSEPHYAQARSRYGIR